MYRLIQLNQPRVIIGAAIVLSILLQAQASVAQGIVRKGMVITESAVKHNTHKRWKRSNGSAASVNKQFFSNDTGAKGYQKTAVRKDSQGNVYKNQYKAATTGNGGYRYKAKNSQSNIDGSITSNTHKSYQSANNASVNSQKNVTKNADGSMDYSKDIQAQSADGKQYQANLSVENGQLIKSTSCIDSSGNAC